MRYLIIALFAIAACGEDNGSGSIPIDGLEPAIIDAFCGIYVRCGAIPDDASCRDLYGNEINLDASLIAAVKAGLVIYHGDKARECLNSIGTSCDRSQVFGNRSQPVACQQTFEGTVGDMGTCGLNEECISQDCNLPSCGANMCCSGTCVGGVAPTRPHLNDPCDGSTSGGCVDSYCDTVTTHTCQAYIADGNPCTLSSSCSSGTCNQTCQALVDTNGTCMTSSQCRLLGDSCPTATMVCTPLAGLNATCGSSSDCQLVYVCDATKHCTARPTTGQSCMANGGCVGSYCDVTTMMCTALKPDGAMCTSSQQCLGTNCDNGGTNTCFSDPVCI